MRETSCERRGTAIGFRHLKVLRGVRDRGNMYRGVVAAGECIILLEEGGVSAQTVRSPRGCPEGAPRVP